MGFRVRTAARERGRGCRQREQPLRDPPALPADTHRRHLARRVRIGDRKRAALVTLPHEQENPPAVRAHGRVDRLHVDGPQSRVERRRRPAGDLRSEIHFRDTPRVAGEGAFPVSGKAEHLRGSGADAAAAGQRRAAKHVEHPIPLLVGGEHEDAARRFVDSACLCIAADRQRGRQFSLGDGNDVDDAAADGIEVAGARHCHQFHLAAAELERAGHLERVE